jgi:hypothetical protein
MGSREVELVLLELLRDSGFPLPGGPTGSLVCTDIRYVCV